MYQVQSYCCHSAYGVDVYFCYAYGKAPEDVALPLKEKQVESMLVGKDLA
jgi:hypothetical protein